MFGVKDALVVDFRPDGEGGGLTLEYDFVLQPAP
jgi:hypothetical protein